MAKRLTAADRKSTLVKQQADIFQPIAQHGDFAELCVALYERELNQLAQVDDMPAAALQRRLASLPFYIQRAAHGCIRVAEESPLTLDVQNASWQAPQASKCPTTSSTASAAKTQHQWFEKHAALGLVVPVAYQTAELKTIFLDSIDRVDTKYNRVHLNYRGWFTFSGEGESSAETLLKPNKRVMTAASCGHQWNHKSRINPRTLTLRELLLVATLDWKKFQVALSIAR
ncbi:hypothetical protein [Idiomarina seosinensis]|uniref:Uncharacterized protein n=1 Tax=Idiomarina seosinensis TaxID=281739 RepID=A0A432ZH81_9GAMM|nr:hypothetical protein [Idiomarina seosinensis]RUO77377.1 hypothetical protein CWI81_02525 [Idiomarina seosinensis]